MHVRIQRFGRGLKRRSSTLGSLGLGLTSKPASRASPFLQILNSAIAFGIAALLFAMIFKILPAVLLTWRDVGMGAAMTALLFTAGKFVIGYYIGKSGVASAYGAAASIITLLLWIYYSSFILLFGAEFTKAYAENRGSRTEVA